MTEFKFKVPDKLHPTQALSMLKVMLAESGLENKVDYSISKYNHLRQNDHYKGFVGVCIPVHFNDVIAGYLCNEKWHNSEYFRKNNK